MATSDRAHLQSARPIRLGFKQYKNTEKSSYVWQGPVRKAARPCREADDSPWNKFLYQIMI